MSDEGLRLIQRHAKRAGMSAAAYVREAAARTAGWDEAMNQLGEKVAALEERIAELEASRDDRGG